MGYNDLLKGRYSATSQEYFITFVVKNREPLFDNHDLAALFVKQLKIQNGLWLAWVLMPDHFHGLLCLKEGGLASVVKSLKAKSAIALNQFRQTKGSVWQKGFYDRALRKEEDRKQVARYLVANPLRAGLVENIEEYPFWDAVWR